MAKNTQLTNLAVNAEADALARLLDNGYCKIYDGAQPATGDTAITTQVLLAQPRFAATSAPAAAAGVLTFNAMTADSDAAATGTAAWARLCKADGTPVQDVSVGTQAAGTENLKLNNINIQQHAQVSVTSFTHTVAKATAGS